MNDVWQWDNFITENKEKRLIQLLQTEFPNEQLLFLIYDYFFPVYQKAPKIDPETLAHRLVEYVVQEQQMGRLYQVLAQRCPRAYDKYQVEFDWQRAAERYRAQVKRLYGTMQIFGMADPIPLADIFTDAYILDKPTAYHRHGVGQLHSEFEMLKRDYKRYRGLDLVKQKQRLFILGKPGAGKTTFMKYVAWQTCQGELNKIPLFVPLKVWSDEQIPLMPFLVKQFAGCDWPETPRFIEYLLQTGQAIVLFDGLDEVNQTGQQRDEMIKRLREFSQRYVACPCIITCRIAASDYTFEGFSYVELADFSPEQIEIFIKKWFQADPDLGVNCLAQLQCEENKGLRELAETPLLLTLLCLAFAETLTFPQRRVEVYQEALEALLKKWDSSRKISRDEIYRKLSVGRKEQMFARIAAETFGKGEYFFKQADLTRHLTAHLRLLPPVEEEIDSETVLKAIVAQHGIFVERAYQIYSFSHLTLQEYFTAKYIAENLASDKAKLRATLTLENIANPKWREVLLMVASLLADGDTFIAVFRERLDEFVTADPELTRLLQWADQHVNHFLVGDIYPLVRWIYIYFAFAYNRIHYLTLDIDIVYQFDTDINLTFITDIEHARDYHKDINLLLPKHLTHDNFVSIDLQIDFNLFYLCQLAVILAAIYPPMLFRGYYIEWIDELNRFKNDAILLSRSLQLNTLAQALSQLALPTENKPQTAWQDYADQVRHLMQTHRGLGQEWNLGQEQVEQLNRYFQANELFLRCLELAYVSDREGLRNGLLRLLK